MNMPVANPAFLLMQRSLFGASRITRPFSPVVTPQSCEVGHDRLELRFSARHRHSSLVMESTPPNSPERLHYPSPMQRSLLQAADQELEPGQYQGYFACMKENELLAWLLLCPKEKMIREQIAYVYDDLTTHYAPGSYHIKVRSRASDKDLGSFRGLLVNVGDDSEGEGALPIAALWRDKQKPTDVPFYITPKGNLLIPYVDSNVKQLRPFTLCRAENLPPVVLKQLGMSAKDVKALFQLLLEERAKKVVLERFRVRKIQVKDNIRQGHNVGERPRLAHRKEEVVTADSNDSNMAENGPPASTASGPLSGRKTYVRKPGKPVRPARIMADQDLYTGRAVQDVQLPDFTEDAGELARNLATEDIVSSPEKAPDRKAVSPSIAFPGGVMDLRTAQAKKEKVSSDETLPDNASPLTDGVPKKQFPTPKDVWSKRQ